MNFDEYFIIITPPTMADYIISIIPSCNYSKNSRDVVCDLEGTLFWFLALLHHLLSLYYVSFFFLFYQKEY